MMRYVLLDLVWLGLAGIMSWRLGLRWRRSWFWLALGLLLATWLFDSYLTILPIVRYQPTHHLPWRLGSVPPEDFAYTIAAVLILPALYDRLIHTLYGRSSQ